MGAAVGYVHCSAGAPTVALFCTRAPGASVSMRPLSLPKLFQDLYHSKCPSRRSAASKQPPCVQCYVGYDNASWDGAARADVLQWAMRTSMLCGGQALTHPAEGLLLLLKVKTSCSSSSSNPESPFLFNDGGLLISMATLRTVLLKT